MTYKMKLAEYLDKKAETHIEKLEEYHTFRCFSETFCTLIIMINLQFYSVIFFYDYLNKLNLRGPLLGLLSFGLWAKVNYTCVINTFSRACKCINLGKPIQRSFYMTSVCTFIFTFFVYSSVASVPKALMMAIHLSYKEEIMATKSFEEYIDSMDSFILGAALSKMIISSSFAFFGRKDDKVVEHETMVVELSDLKVCK
ncbi:hypothetical protein AYI69_g8473 [Smittium culicis]|uniref:Uncharacterized protein n=1 Tax=Smittium culicis TaxID=133412 RepID=A0A1R1XJB7_9FUNG|nr:hypothetical protein AYI69_g8473 [Smittium culicis]